MSLFCNAKISMQNPPTQVPQVLPVFPWDNWTGLGSSSGGLTLRGGKIVAGVG